MKKILSKLSKSAQDNVNLWLSDEKFSEYKEDIQSLIDSERWQELEDSFFKKIEFGTAGCRGKTGVGSNRINNVTIGEASQALCDYALVFEDSTEKGIVIAYDTRNTSRQLSQLVASVVAANGIKVYLFEDFRSTPELSFAVRHLGCVAGVVISASHNPPTDNGFKAYSSDGCQVVSENATRLLLAAQKITSIKRTNYESAVSDGRILIIGKEVDDAYISAVSSYSQTKNRDIKIVYSPLHGTGQKSTLLVLRGLGFDQIDVVDAQMIPDGNFPTITSNKPNPEDEIANKMAVDMMLEKNYDIAITNDPDADRIGVIVNQEGAPVYLNGNQSAILATNYLLSKLSDKGSLGADDYIAKTIVTTDMITELSSRYGVICFNDLLIGFKYIGELILNREKIGGKFLLGCEESYGMLVGDYARDKDAAVGSLMLAEYAAELKKDGKTLYDELMDIYKTNGIFVERLKNLVCEGASGFQKMQRIMSSIRQNGIKEIAGQKVTLVADYQSLSKHDLSTGLVTSFESVKGDIIVLEFADHRKRVTIRPSGTEPKIKLYGQWMVDKFSDDVVGEYKRAEAYLDMLLEELNGKLSEL